MTLNPSAKKSLRKHAGAKTGYLEALTILQLAHADKGPASDRALAIQGTAMIEHALESRIKQHFPKIDEETAALIFGFGESGPLSSLGARNLIAYALKIYGPITFEDIKTIGELRNAFAHSAKPIDFSFPAIGTLCNSLQLTQYSTGDMPNTTRDQFSRFVAQVVGSLTVHLSVNPGGGGLKIEPIQLP